ncbi:hypothetical protein N7530_007979 [Penicillium desertorum]|uniref:Uncharacterized protein n=1 Tax=Penicillium desertorum TaxID=1303715 RepID=A0A9W9WNE2_9EURO|nr:hypothetical protein N7530_007979 [Penicillium desertorum]
MNRVFGNQAHGGSALRQHLPQLSRPEHGRPIKRKRKRKVWIPQTQIKSCVRDLSTQENKMRNYQSAQMLVLQQSQHTLFSS